MSAFTLGAATINPSARSVTINGVTRRLSPKSAAVLDALLEANGDVVSRAALIERVWPDVCVNEEILTQAITELRRAFDDSPRNASYIETVPKAGYRLAAPVGRSEPPDGFLLPPSYIEAGNSIEAIASCLSAFEAFERGGRHWINIAIEQCRTSIEHDPSFSPAYAQLSAALVYKHLYYGSRPGLLKEALDAAQSAIRFDRTAPEGYAAQGFALAYLGDLDHAITSYKAAMRLRSDSYLVMLSFGRVLFARGYARLLYERDLHDRLLNEVVAADPYANGLTLANVLAQEDAAALLAGADDYF